MRRFLAYFNALLLGMILGMVFLAIIQAVPFSIDWPRQLCEHVTDDFGIHTPAVTPVSVSFGTAKLEHFRGITWRAQRLQSAR